MKKHKTFLKKIRQYVEEIEPQAEVVLFGSRARGNEKDDSDWDILILVPGEASLKEEQRFRHKLFELELEFEEAISTFVYSKSDWTSKHRITPLYKNIEREGIAL